jgi:uncharacterized protein (DUF1810 family)
MAVAEVAMTSDMFGEANLADTADPFNLQRFVDAQSPVYERVLRELSAGAKQSHWMWFVFPQIAGLGHSAMADKFAIRTLDEAKAYWVHATLGPRLAECTRLLLAIAGKSAVEILGYPDDLKFRSSMTLFAQAAPDEPIFGEAIRKYFNGAYDKVTLSTLLP